jgi:formamidopyrimidine-DNA glycosylase
LISGVGNIYADEALWGARLHYARATDRMRRPEIDRLLQEIDRVLRAAITAGGTSFDALYVAVNGESGWFDRSLHVYGRVGEPCDRCGTPIARQAFMNRSSFFCPKCQTRPRNGRW